MGLISVLLAAAVAWGFGVLWYMVLGTRWMDAAGLTDADIDRGDPVPYVVAYLCAVAAAVMTRHILATAGIADAGPAFVSGLGLGLFVAAPFVATSVILAQRARSLIWIDGTYPAIAMALMALVLSWFM